VNVCEHTVKTAPRVFTYTYLLIEKDICDRLTISIKLPSVSVCLLFGDLFIFSIRVLLYFSIFCVVCALVLSFPHGFFHEPEFLSYNCKDVRSWLTLLGKVGEDVL
jgi:hypothetical protein